MALDEAVHGKPIEAVVSYSHRDERYRTQLETHLSLLRRQGLLGLWQDRKIGPGTEWETQISNHFESAELILLLVSPDFIASDYCYDIELKGSLERHEAGLARVVPIVIRPVDWHDAPFAKLQALPSDGKPVSTWANRDTAFRNVVDGLRRVIQELRTTKLATYDAQKPATDSPNLSHQSLQPREAISGHQLVSERWPARTVKTLRIKLTSDVRATLVAWMQLYGQANEVPGLASGSIESRFAHLREEIPAADRFFFWTTPDDWMAGGVLSLRIPRLFEFSCSLTDGHLVADKVVNAPKNGAPPARPPGSIGIVLHPERILLPLEDDDVNESDIGIEVLGTYFAQVWGGR
jgi:hypothetical protein